MEMRHPNHTPTASPREAQMQRHDRKVLENPSFNWNAQDRYVELLNTEMETMQTYKTFTNEEKEERKLQKDSFQY